MVKTVDAANPYQYLTFRQGRIERKVYILVAILGWGINTMTRLIENLPIDRLRPWPRNARSHSRKQIRQIAESISRFGFTNPVLIDGDNRILAGHGRVEAARELGRDHRAVPPDRST